MRNPTFATFLLLFSLDGFAENLPKIAEEKKRNYYVKSTGYSSNPEPDPPNYVKQLDKTNIEAFKNIDWIDAGLSSRLRFEYRDNDYRRSVDKTDNLLLWRTQAYFGVKNILDPLRFAIELQDSRRYHSKFARSTGDVNKLDVFQAYGELYFKNPLILDRPLSLRAGRMAFELMDRKMLARDDWGNTGTNFQGFRATIGEKENDWQLDSFAMQPMEKLLERSDEVSKDKWVYGGIFSWRRWSEILTLQPFFLKLTQAKSASSLTTRNINSPGLRLYGTFGSGFDYDLIGVYQFGESESEPTRAYAYATELGYSSKQAWNPRYSLVYGYASGDKKPGDGKNQRFERFYGFNRSWSNSNHIEWENIEILKGRIEFQPDTKLRFESSYSFYWLASGTDELERANLRDSSGSSGDYVGRDFDFRAHYEISDNLRSTLGYAHFMPGKFTKNTSHRTGDSDFVYLELTYSLFGK